MAMFDSSGKDEQGRWSSRELVVDYSASSKVPGRLSFVRLPDRSAVAEGVRLMADTHLASRSKSWSTPSSRPSASASTYLSTTRLRSTSST